MKRLKRHQKNSRITSANTQQGAVLLEALIAILIFSFGILALAGLQSVMIKNTTDASYRAEASNLAQQQLGRLWADPNNLDSYVTAAPVSINSLPSGTIHVEQPFQDKVIVTVTWQLPGEAQHNYQANAYVLKGCPTC
jgi:type IV pilus assembly protein PilV